MKKKNTFLGVALLIAVLVLGIGYAATTQTLKVSGTATGVESEENFNVIFTAAKAGDAYGDDATGVTAGIDTVNDSTSRTAVVTAELGTVGSSAAATFTITNSSANGIAAKFDSKNIRVQNAEGLDFVSDYFLVTTDFVEGEITLQPGESTTFTVYVDLQKAIVGENHSEQFYVVLDGFTSAAATE